MKIRLPLTYLVPLFILFYSCEKNDDVALSRANSTTGLHKVIVDSEIYHEYTYTETNQIREEKSKLYYTQHNYSKNRISSSDFYVDNRMYSSDWETLQEARNREEWVNPDNTEKEGSTIYSYSKDGKLIGSSGIKGRSEFSYDSDNRICKLSFFDEERLLNYTNFEFDNRGNLKKKSFFIVATDGISSLETVTEYQYDNKLNPYNSFHALPIPGRNTNLNNITKEIHLIYNEAQEISDKLTTKYAYMYNSKGYPVKVNDVEDYIYYDN